jgi:hypothetical protein
MDVLFGDQVVPHALEDAAGAKAAMAAFNEKAGLAAVSDQVEQTPPAEGI